MILVYSATCAADSWTWRHKERWRHVCESKWTKKDWKSPSQRLKRHTGWILTGTWDLECLHSLVPGQRDSNSWMKMKCYLAFLQLSCSGEPLTRWRWPVLEEESGYAIIFSSRQDMCNVERMGLALTPHTSATVQYHQALSPRVREVYMIIGLLWAGPSNPIA